MAHKVSSSEASTSSSEGDYDELWEIPWVQIPDVPYIAKYKFDDDKYMILITNLSETHGEKLAAAEVQERFSMYNPHAEMKTYVLMKHLEDSLQYFLEKQSIDSKFMQQCAPSQAITIHLTFKVCQVRVTFDIKPQLLPNEKLRSHVIAPTILTSNIVYREYDRLKKSIWNKIPTEKMYDSRLNKKSKISEIELLDAFLKFQSTVQNCMERSKACEDEHNNDEERNWQPSEYELAALARSRIEPNSPIMRLVLFRRSPVGRKLKVTKNLLFNITHWKTGSVEVDKGPVITLREEPLKFHREFEFTDEEIFGVFNSGVKDPSASDLLKDYKLDVKRENVKKNYIGKRKKPSSNEPQSPEMSATSVKQKIEDSSKTKDDSVVALKQKKKRCLKF